MPREETLEGIPSSDVGEIVQSFVNDGAIRIECVPNSDETWDVTATFE